MLVPLQQNEHIECPHCQRHTVVRHGESEYVCLNCNFRRDLAHNSPREAFGGFLGFLLMVLLGLVLVVGLAQ